MDRARTNQMIEELKQVGIIANSTDEKETNQSPSWLISRSTHEQKFTRMPVRMGWELFFYNIE